MDSDVARFVRALSRTTSSIRGVHDSVMIMNMLFAKADAAELCFRWLLDRDTYRQLQVPETLGYFFLKRFYETERNLQPVQRANLRRYLDLIVSLLSKILPAEDDDSRKGIECLLFVYQRIIEMTSLHKIPIREQLDHLQDFISSFFRDITEEDTTVIGLRLACWYADMFAVMQADHCQPTFLVRVLQHTLNVFNEETIRQGVFLSYGRHMFHLYDILAQRHCLQAFDDRFLAIASVMFQLPVAVANARGQISTTPVIDSMLIEFGACIHSLVRILDNDPLKELFDRWFAPLMTCCKCVRAAFPNVWREIMQNLVLTLAKFCFTPETPDEIVMPLFQLAMESLRMTEMDIEEAQINPVNFYVSAFTQDPDDESLMAAGRQLLGALYVSTGPLRILQAIAEYPNRSEKMRALKLLCPAKGAPSSVLMEIVRESIGVPPDGHFGLLQALDMWRCYVPWFPDDCVGVVTTKVEEMFHAFDMDPITLTVCSKVVHRLLTLDDYIPGNHIIDLLLRRFDDTCTCVGLRTLARGLCRSEEYVQCRQELSETILREIPLTIDEIDFDDRQFRGLCTALMSLIERGHIPVPWEALTEVFLCLRNDATYGLASFLMCVRSLTKSQDEGLEFFIDKMCDRFQNDEQATVDSAFLHEVCSFFWYYVVYHPERGRMRGRCLFEVLMGLVPQGPGSLYKSDCLALTRFFSTIVQLGAQLSDKFKELRQWGVDLFELGKKNFFFFCVQAELFASMACVSGRVCFPGEVLFVWIPLAESGYFATPYLGQLMLGAFKLVERVGFIDMGSLQRAKFFLGPGTIPLNCRFFKRWIKILRTTPEEELNRRFSWNGVEGQVTIGPGAPRLNTGQ